MLHSEEAFQDALKETLRFEGGYANRPLADDPGGETNLGVTQETLNAYRLRFPDDDDMADSVKVLTRKQATRIYRRMYWEAIKGDELPEVLALVTFDAAVHSGPSRAARWLQEALGVNVDGHIGPVTIEASWSRLDDRGTADLALGIRERFLRGLRNAPRNPGWWARIARLRELVA